MSRQSVLSQKKKRGPAPTGKGTLIGVRLQPDELSALDAWIEEHAAPEGARYTRPGAIRQLIDIAIDVSRKQGR